MSPNWHAVHSIACPSLISCMPIQNVRDLNTQLISHRLDLYYYCFVAWFFNPDQAIARFNLSNCAFLGLVNFTLKLKESLFFFLILSLQHVLVQIDKTNQWTEGVSQSVDSMPSVIDCVYSMQGDGFGDIAILDRQKINKYDMHSG